MKTTAKMNGGFNQMRWVVLLLAVAVILPTLCLLWFMSRAVKNERLAVRQKLSDIYRQRLETLSNRIDELWSARIDALEQQAAMQRQPVEIFEKLVSRDTKVEGSKICDAIIILDNNGKLIYPVTGGGEPPAGFSDELNVAWSVEFTLEDFAGAARLYEQIADSIVDDYTRYSALMGKVRCLKKLGTIEQALALCEKIAYGQTPENISSSSAALIARARILLVNLQSETKDGLKRSDLQNLINSVINYTPRSDYGFLPMPSETRVFLLSKAIEIVQKSVWAEELQPQVLKAKELLSAEKLAVSVLDRYYAGVVSEPWSENDEQKMISLLRATLDTIEELKWSWGWTEQLKRQISIILGLSQARQTQAAGFGWPAFTAPFSSWPENSLRKLDLLKEVYGIYHKAGDKTYLLLHKADRFNFDFDVCGQALKELGVSYRITDNLGMYACGLENPEKPAFLRAALGQFFPGWHVEIHFMDFDVFEKTAGKQAVVYMWTGLLAIAIMIAAGLLAAQVVGKQIKTNRLKNDFIATVSHELKTPLASMRVLVDTLLEGNYKDQQQVTEYLQLVSKENERLTGLIDNFLTFSRMERNKRAFRLVRTSANSIAKAAAEAVKTKFNSGRCRFEIDIRENLPDVPADHDGMVTVLINLLDNAYKYSHDDKHIKLQVFSDAGWVCFQVTDKGMGMSRRSARRIFMRFYQVDRRLTRGVEGCGLGLSIAKFIIDAHKGTISVESKIGEGSTFTVRLPAYNKPIGERTNR
jgi:signal transduction histidine kinase